MHMCCGYPDKLDETDYVKADSEVYRRLARAVEASIVDAVSIEDGTGTTIFPCSACSPTPRSSSASSRSPSRVETVDEIVARLRAALDHIDADRLMAAPDCGLISWGPN